MMVWNIWNIVGCLLKRGPTKGGSRAPQDPPSLATPLFSVSKFHIKVQTD